MLRTDSLDTGYGKKQVLRNVAIHVAKGEIVALIGPNGSGKSTALKAICGLLSVWSGEILFEGKNINDSMPAKNVARGITYAPQGNRIFADLTVMENLEVGGYQLPNKELTSRIDNVLTFFPNFRKIVHRSAGKLSGGEQQMLSVARALIPNPKLLLLDEPSLGLAPNLMRDVFHKVVEISHKTGVSILIVEQKVREVLRICDKVYAIKLGKIAFEGPPDELVKDEHRLKQLFL